MKLLIVDCFDSFTYNIFHYFEQVNNIECDVVRYNEFQEEGAIGYEYVVLSPGPGLPKDYPKIAAYLSIRPKAQPVLGVCLGHQCIAEHYGAALERLNKVQHGIVTRINQTGNSALYNGLPKVFNIGHYHSWVVSKNQFPNELLSITSISEDGWIMSLEHNEEPLYGLQFHPESVMTDYGMEIVKNWIEGLKSS